MYQKRHLKFQFEKEQLQSEYKQALLKSQLEIQEQTFNHISQEIHDNVGQILSVAKLQANILKETGDMGLVDDVKENISKALTDLRDIAKSLSSERMRNISILEAVTFEADRINKSGVIHIIISCEGEKWKLDEQKNLILFRIIQECLQNIIKHAQATEVNLLFNYVLDKLDVIVKDNGMGFDVKKMMSKNSGLGLQNINSRISLIGGELSIESTLDVGSIVTIQIPHE
jgi:two-component system NarL family sensor kinase